MGLKTPKLLKDIHCPCSIRLCQYSLRNVFDDLRVQGRVRDTQVCTVQSHTHRCECDAIQHIVTQKCTYTLLSVEFPPNYEDIISLEAKSATLPFLKLYYVILKQMHRISMTFRMYLLLLDPHTIPLTFT